MLTGTLARINESTRNVSMRHASSKVHQENYLPRHITQHTTAVFLRRRPDDVLLRQFTGMRRTIDRRRPQGFPEEVKRKFMEDPKLTDLKPTQRHCSAMLQAGKGGPSGGNHDERIPLDALDKCEKKADNAYNATYMRLYAARLALLRRAWDLERPRRQLEAQMGDSPTI